MLLLRFSLIVAQPLSFTAVEESMPLTGKIVGYDPGGNGKHGVAALIVDNGRPLKLSFTTVRNAQAALYWFKIGEIPIAAGIDTLTVCPWETVDGDLRTSGCVGSIHRSKIALSTQTTFKEPCR